MIALLVVEVVIGCGVGDEFERMTVTRNLSIQPSQVEPVNNVLLINLAEILVP